MFVKKYDFYVNIFIFCLLKILIFNVLKPNLNLKFESKKIIRTTFSDQ
jgi:hypothetical protein